MNFQERTRARAERESSIGRGGSGRHFRPKLQQLSAVQPQHAGFPHQFHLYLSYSLQVKVQLQAWLHGAVGWEARILPLVRFRTAWPGGSGAIYLMVKLPDGFENVSCLSS